jgi:nicotinamidase-related amidase
MTSTIDPKKSALLLLDLQVGILGRLPADVKDSVVSSAASAISTARKAGATVAYVHAALTESDIAAIPDFNPMFAPIKSHPEMAAAFHPEAPTTQIDERIAPQPGDLFHRKNRVGTFQREPSKALLDEFYAKGIKTVFISGVISSGAVESAVRQLADLDFQLFVLEDACADYDPEVHKVLCEKVFPKQASVIKVAEMTSKF